jgi:hypothetical protein
MKKVVFCLILLTITIVAELYYYQASSEIADQISFVALLALIFSIFLFVKKIRLFSLIFAIWLVSASYAGNTGNEIANLIALFAFFIMVLVLLKIFWPRINKVFPHGIGYQENAPIDDFGKEVWVSYPRIYNKVSFGVLIVIFLVVVLIANERSSLPVVHSRPIGQEALEMSIFFFVGAVMFSWSHFIWTYSASYRLTSEGFQWMAPWSRKRFVRWDEVKNIWYTPTWGMGIWIKTTKGRYRIDMDMINAGIFLERIRPHISSKTMSKLL